MCVTDNASLNKGLPLVLFGCGGREDWTVRGHFYVDMRKLMGRQTGQNEVNHLFMCVLSHV